MSAGRGAYWGPPRDQEGGYRDGEAVATLDTVLLTLGLGVLAAAQLGVGGKVQVVVHNLTPLHEEQGPFWVQSTFLIQIACDLIGYLAGLQVERGEVTEHPGRVHVEPPGGACKAP